MKRIGVVLATPPGFNGGMVATELALDAFLARRGWTALVQRYRFLRLAERFHGRPEALRRIHARGYDDAGCWSARERYDELAASDVILYWADFLHLAQYLAALRRLAEPVEKIFLLAHAGDAVLARTISFGTNLLFNTARDEADPSYGPPLRRFMRGARRV